MMKKLLFLISYLVVTLYCGTCIGNDINFPLDAIMKDEKGIVALADFNTGNILYYFNNIDDGTQRYAPGSTIKLILSVLLIRDNSIGDDFMVDCSASSPDVPIEQRCWDIAGHGVQDFQHAFANSCNRFFLKAALNVKKDDFVKSLKDFALIDSDKIDDLTNSDMIGLGLKLPVNPLDVLSSYMALLNGGVLYRWYGINNQDHKPVIKKNIKVERYIYEKIKNMMVDASAYGTSSDAVKKLKLEPFPSKTGTAYYRYDGIADYEKTHGWFLGFYPKEGTKIAVLVFLLEGKGTKEASLLGAKIIDVYVKSNK